MEFGFGLARLVDERGMDTTSPCEMVCNLCGESLGQFPSPTEADMKGLMARLGLTHKCAKIATA